MGREIVNLGIIAILDSEDRDDFRACLWLYQQGVVPKDWPDAMFLAYADKYGFAGTRDKCFIMENGDVILTMQLAHQGGADN